jgi:hypothetical protein
METKDDSLQRLIMENSSKINQIFQKYFTGNTSELKLNQLLPKETYESFSSNHDCLII